MEEEDNLSKSIIGCALEVHRILGPGLLESAYSEALAFEFHTNAIPFLRQHPLPLNYKNLRLDCGFRVDFLVAGIVIVEIKTVDRLIPIHSAQVITYLKLSGCKLGLLLNFNSKLLKDGIRRIVMNL